MKQLWKMVLPITGRWGMVKYVITGLLSGLCSFLFINMVTRVIGLLVTGGLTGISQEYIIIFAAIILLFVWTRRTLSLTIIHLSQRLFWNLRKQILTLMLGTGYQQMAARKTAVYTAIVNDVNTLTQASLSIIDFFTATVLAFSCLIYLASVSWILFLITLVFAFVGVGIYHFSAKRNNDHFQRARGLEEDFVRQLNAILNGFKEIFMEPRKGKAIYEQRISSIADKAYQDNTTAFTGFLNNQITGQILFYMLISSILLFFSVILKVKPGNTVSFVFTLLYLLTSIETIMVLLPSLSRAGVASDRLMKLKTALANAGQQNTIADNYIGRDDFEQITVTDLEFSYGGEDRGFGIGPVNLEINSGEVAFIYGGNGSGKTTFIHTLLGLNKPTAGEIRLNDVPVTSANYNTYKTCFAVVFSDFYLFNDLIGIGQPDMEKWQYYLRLFELEDKIKLEGTDFSTTDLSTGQRKRLALIAAMLENKPVLIIDEWAADQDPYFRKKFYTEIIPILKQEGIAIVAITHDDRYYHCADRIYRMDYGKLIEEDVNIYARL
jgi:putative pyoverdin transport system ATP-binding/permease protein